MYKLISIKKNKRDDFQLLLSMNGCRPPLHVLLDIKKIKIYIYTKCVEPIDFPPFWFADR